eukprot:TRINITY_DN6752_c0_g1_i1.p1 TRINITY_DN6752_c0_g1~~TRINITY_DN6752_c0_g1_i1.p1  ORF type:complete len:186 (+),score=-3.27 TRINITY_DN6752_c0_g1_i1:277-834(+)
MWVFISMGELICYQSPKLSGFGQLDKYDIMYYFNFFQVKVTMQIWVVLSWMSNSEVFCQKLLQFFRGQVCINFSTIFLLVLVWCRCYYQPLQVFSANPYIYFYFRSCHGPRYPIDDNREQYKYGSCSSDRRVTQSQTHLIEKSFEQTGVGKTGVLLVGFRTAAGGFVVFYPQPQNNTSQNSFSIK